MTTAPSCTASRTRSGPSEGVRLPGLGQEGVECPLHLLLDDAVARVLGGLVGELRVPLPPAIPFPTLTLIAHQEALLEPFLVWARALGREATPQPPGGSELVQPCGRRSCRGSVFEWLASTGSTPSPPD